MFISSHTSSKLSSIIFTANTVVPIHHPKEKSTGMVTTDEWGGRSVDRSQSKAVHWEHMGLHGHKKITSPPATNRFGEQKEVGNKIPPTSPNPHQQNYCTRNRLCQENSWAMTDPERSQPRSEEKLQNRAINIYAWLVGLMFKSVLNVNDLISNGKRYNLN